MTATPLTNANRPSRAFARVVAACVLALQALLATAPVWEDNVASRPVTHVDEGGTQHVSLHGDTNCGLCALRAQTPMPPTDDMALGDGSERHAIPAAVETFGGRDDAASHRSRAPPQLG
jgi:hypothetical protein